MGKARERRKRDMKGKTRRWQFSWSHILLHLAPISDFLIMWKSKYFIAPPSLVWVSLSQISSTCYWKTFSPFCCAFNSIYRAFIQVPNLSSTVTWPASEIRPLPVHSFIETWIKCWVPSSGTTLHPYLQATYFLSTPDRVLFQGFAACSLVNSDGVSLRES